MDKNLRFLFLCLCAVFFLATQADAQCASFFDGFESGNWQPTWSHAGGTYTRNVTTTNPGSGTYSFEQTGTGTHTQGVVASFPAVQPTSVSYKVKTSAQSSTGTYFVIGDASTSSNLGIFFCYFASTGKIRVYSSGTSVYEQNFTANTWYTIEMRNIDYTAKTYDIWIDNVQVATSFPFRTQSTTALERIYLYNLSTSVTATYDDIFVSGSPLATTPTATDVLCPADSNGTASVNVSGGTPGYSYVWSNSDTTASISNLAPGTYYVTITDSNGCVGNDSAVVGIPPALAATHAVSDALCNGDSTGSIDLSVSGGTPPYTFSWSNSSTAEDPTGLQAGSYAVVITDSNGCTQSDSAQVGEPTAVVLSATVLNVACNGDANGAIDLAVSGGTPGYAYLWNTSATSEDLSGLSGGTYSVFVSDSNGCSTGDIYTVNEPAVLASSGVTSDDHGTNDGTIDLSVSGGTPPYSFMWSNSATTEDLSGLAAGTYSVTVTDSNGCVATDTFVVDFSIGVDVAMAGPHLQLYPNPGTGLVNVIAGLNAPGPVRIQVTDLRGRTLYERTTEVAANSWETQLDLRNLASGVYLLSLEAEGQRTVRRYTRQ